MSLSLWEIQETPSGANVMGQEAQFRQLQEDCRKLAEPLVRIAKLRQGQANVIELMTTALGKLPPGTTMGKAIDELRKNTETLLKQLRDHRTEEFRKLISDHVREAKKRNVGCRELDGGWRIGRFEFRTKPEESKLQVLYNGQVVVPWSVVTLARDLKKLEETAESKFKRIPVSDERLIDLLWLAYNKIRDGRQQAKKPNPELVPINDVYVQLRLELVRSELQSRPDCELRSASFPKWTYLYLLDRYRSIAAKTPEKKRLSFETGSQQDSKRLGFMLNGLDAKQDYMTFCYLKAVRGN